jgi:hypothetical protein
MLRELRGLFLAIPALNLNSDQNHPIIQFIGNISPFKWYRTWYIDTIVNLGKRSEGRRCPWSQAEELMHNMRYPKF